MKKMLFYVAAVLFAAQNVYALDNVVFRSKGNMETSQLAGMAYLKLKSSEAGAIFKNKDKMPFSYDFLKLAVTSTMMVTMEEDENILHSTQTVHCIDKMSTDELLQHVFAASTQYQLKNLPIVSYVGYVALHQCGYIEKDMYVNMMEKLAENAKEMAHQE